MSGAQTKGFKASAAIVETSLREEDNTEIASETLDSSFEEKEDVIQARAAKLKKAEELEELLLQKACLELMRETTSLSEAVKRVQYNKFYPEKYKLNAEMLKDLGTKVDRRPPYDGSLQQFKMGQSTAESVHSGEAATSSPTKASDVTKKEPAKSSMGKGESMYAKVITKSPLRSFSSGNRTMKKALRRN